MSDLISRQALLKKLEENIGINTPEWLEDAINRIPSAQHKPLKYTGDSICLYCQTVNCDGCMYEPMEGVQ